MEKELCNICYEELIKKDYGLIKHSKDINIKDATMRGHYFHLDCLNQGNIIKCPFDREKIKSLKKIKCKIKLENIHDYSSILHNNLLIEDIKTSINRTDLYGRTILYYACNTMNYALVKKLLFYNADITIGNNDNFTPLMCICSNGAADILKILLNNKLIEYTIFNVDKNNLSALEYAIKYNNSHIIILLLDYLKKNNKTPYIELILNKWSQ